LNKNSKIEVIQELSISSIAGLIRADRNLAEGKNLQRVKNILPPDFHENLFAQRLCSATQNTRKQTLRRIPSIGCDLLTEV
jgi:hypothetical protein